MKVSRTCSYLSSRIADFVAIIVGHWFGLYHTFQGGCAEPNDYCDDTPAQKEPSYSNEDVLGDKNSCPAKDTCPKMAGNDNVFNFVSPFHELYEPEQITDFAR
jgi:hypothetical protein